MTEFEPSDNHWVIKPVGTFREKVTKKQLQHVLLNRPDPIIEGRLHEWESRKRGPGVYELYVGEPRRAEDD